ETAGDGLVRVAAGDQAQHLKLARGQSMAVSGSLAVALEARADRLYLGEVGPGAQSCKDFAGSLELEPRALHITQRDTRPGQQHPQPCGEIGRSELLPDPEGAPYRVGHHARVALGEPD